MAGMQAQHSHGVDDVPHFPTSVSNIHFESCHMNKAVAAKQNKQPACKPDGACELPFVDRFGLVQVPSAGVIYCIGVICHYIYWIQMAEIHEANK